jgi:hypothetical protein
LSDLNLKAYRSSSASFTTGSVNSDLAIFVGKLMTL